jgi:hypothetical protein
MREDEVGSLGLIVEGKQDFMDAAAAGLPSIKVANPQPPVAAYLVESSTIN